MQALLFTLGQTDYLIHGVKESKMQRTFRTSVKMGDQGATHGKVRKTLALAAFVTTTPLYCDFMQTHASWTHLKDLNHSLLLYSGVLLSFK